MNEFFLAEPPKESVVALWRARPCGQNTDEFQDVLVRALDANNGEESVVAASFILQEDMDRSHRLRARDYMIRSIECGAKFTVLATLLVLEGLQILSDRDLQRASIRKFVETFTRSDTHGLISSVASCLMQRLQ